jgi:multidrug resistance efflux pump
MKNKIMKFLEKPKVVIPLTLLIALVLGFFVYKFVGYGPKDELGNLVPNVPVDQIKDGQVVDLAFPKSGRVNAVSVKTGDVVKKGQVLANLDFADVRGALDIAHANYQKVLNGATGTDIDVAKATVASAQTALDQIKLQQGISVANAKKNLLNSGFVVTTNDNLSSQLPPIITGTYLYDTEGIMTITTYASSGGSSFKTSGLVDAIGMESTEIPQPIGDTGLFIKFSNPSDRTIWTLDIPNTESPGYTANLNAYQAAQATETQMIANATATLSQAQSALALKQASARPEDVAAAAGALSAAQGAYDNDFIYAPADGVITVVNLNVGAIAGANQRVISMITKTITN